MDEGTDTSAEAKMATATVNSTPSSSSSKSSDTRKELYYQQDALTNAAMKIQFDIFARQSQNLQQILTKLSASGLRQQLVKAAAIAEAKEEEFGSLLSRRILPEEYGNINRKLGAFT